MVFAWVFFIENSGANLPMAIESQLRFPLQIKSKNL